MIATRNAVKGAFLVVFFLIAKVNAEKRIIEKGKIKKVIELIAPDAATSEGAITQKKSIKKCPGKVYPKIARITTELQVKYFLHS